MTINEHLSSFAGRPVVTVEPGEPLPAVDGPVAWRFAFSDYDGGRDYGLSAPFRDAFNQWLDGIDTSAVEALVIGPWGYAAFNDAPISQLCEVAGRLPGLRALFLGDMTFEECEISWMRVGDLTPLFTAYPDLEVLAVRGAEELRLDPVRHAHLRELTFQSGGLPAEVVRTVLSCDLPALRHLELWLGVEDYGGDTTVEDLAPLLSGEVFPALRHLGLRNAEHTDDIAAAVASAPVVTRLETLDLSLGNLRDAGAEALLAGQSLTHLRLLDLHHHYLSEPMRARLSGALPGVEVDLSDWEEPDEDDDEVYYYTAVAE